jgi:hypothetical protein
MEEAASKATSGKRTIEITAKSPRDFTQDFACPEFHATLTQAYATEKGVGEELDVKVLREQINRACDEVNEGNMRLPERMALAQALTLDHLFNHLAQRAISNLGGHWCEPYMRLALRAQSQSARTLETLAALKNPTIFAKQLNVANQQVVSNGTATLPEPTRAPKSLPDSAAIVPLAKTELLTRDHARVDR